MKKSIAMLLGVSLLFIMSACSSKQPAKQKTELQTPFSMSAETQDSTTAETEVPTDSITSEKEETTSELLTKSEEKTNSQAEQTRQPEMGTTSQQNEPIKSSTASESIGKPAETSSEPATELPETSAESAVEKPETSSEPSTELPEKPKEEEPMKQAQFYITAKNTTFTANFADNGSADAFRNLLREGDLTINMSDYGSFEKVGSIGTSLPSKDTQISATAGDVVLYQSNQIVIFYGTNSWSYSRLGNIDGAAAEALLSAFGNGDVAITFSLTKPQ